MKSEEQVRKRLEEITKDIDDKKQGNIDPAMFTSLFAFSAMKAALEWVLQD